MAELRTLKQAMALMNLIERHDRVEVMKATKLSGLPPTYLSIVYYIGNKPFSGGISPEGEVST